MKQLPTAVVPEIIMVLLHLATLTPSLKQLVYTMLLEKKYCYHY